MADIDRDIEMQDKSKTEWVRITSSDGYSYLVKRKIAEVSGTMRDMLDAESKFSEGLTRICPVQQRGIIVEKMVEYMSFKAHNETLGSKEEVPIHDYLDRVPPEIVLELLLAADYQDM